MRELATHHEMIPGSVYQVEVVLNGNPDNGNIKRYVRYIETVDHAEFGRSLLVERGSVPFHIPIKDLVAAWEVS